MGLFQRLLVGFKQTPTAQSGVNVSAVSGQMVPPRPKTLAELEQEMELATRQMIAQRSAGNYRPPNRLWNRLLGLGLLVGIPAGMLWFVNLPYPPIRRPVAAHASLLLLPSYISLDQNFREAIALTQQAQQLIDHATSPADLDMGQQQLKQAQEKLDQLPIWMWDYWYDGWHGWYGWRFTVGSFNQARADVGRLQAKVFQEQNAQTALITAEQALLDARQQYQQAQTSVNQTGAIANWRTALHQFEQIPADTLAGHSAQTKLKAYQQEFTETVGLAAGDQRTLAILQAAQEYSRQAAQSAQNPPHSAAEWQQIEQLWTQAIQGLEQISVEDVQGYAEAQRRIVQYQANRNQIQLRRQAEAASVQSFESAQQQIDQLLNQGSDRNNLMGEIRGILRQLEQVQPGTTVYKDAEVLRIQAQNKLDQLTGQP